MEFVSWKFARRLELIKYELKFGSALKRIKVILDLEIAALDKTWLEYCYLLEDHQKDVTNQNQKSATGDRPS